MLSRPAPGAAGGRPAYISFGGKLGDIHVRVRARPPPVRCHPLPHSGKISVASQVIKKRATLCVVPGDGSGGFPRLSLLT